MTVPVEALSRFGAPRLATTSSRCTVLKSILNRVRPEVLGTLECICAAANKMIPPAGNKQIEADLRLALERLDWGEAAGEDLPSDTGRRGLPDGVGSIDSSCIRFDVFRTGRLQ